MLRLSNFADYAVLVMTAAARSAPEERPLSAGSVARHTGIPQATAAKLLGQLARAGLLLSHRGVAGGFDLSRDPADISLADIVEAIEGPIALTHCSAHDSECGLSDNCAVRPHWDPVNRAVKTALAQVSLAELAGPARAPAKELCA